MVIPKISSEVTAYNEYQKDDSKLICELLADLIIKHLKNAENKVWHGGPVWFIDGNPIVGYWVRKNEKVQLLFWSGQSFKEEKLKQVGGFKAAEKIYTNVKEIKKAEIKRWLKKSEQIQWDYKNIIKRKGALNKI